MRPGQIDVPFAKPPSLEMFGRPLGLASGIQNSIQIGA
jgi:hypothetical protein